MTSPDGINLRCLQLSCDWINRHPKLATTTSNARYAARVAAQTSSNIISVCSIQKPGFLPAILQELPAFSGVLKEVGIDKIALLWDTRVWRKTQDVVASRPGKFVHACLENVADETSLDVFATNQNAVTPSALKALVFAVANVRDDVDEVVVTGAFEPNLRIYESAMHDLGLVDVMKVDAALEEEDQEEEGDDEEELVGSVKAEDLRLNRIYSSDAFEDAKGFVLEQCSRLANSPVLLLSGEDEEDIVVELLFVEERSEEEEEEEEVEDSVDVVEEVQVEPERELNTEADALEAIMREASQAMTKAKALLQSGRLDADTEEDAKVEEVEDLKTADLPSVSLLVVNRSSERHADVGNTSVVADRSEVEEKQETRLNPEETEDSCTEEEGSMIAVEEKGNAVGVSSGFEEADVSDDDAMAEEKSLDVETNAVVDELEQLLEVNESITSETEEVSLNLPVSSFDWEDKRYLLSAGPTVGIESQVSSTVEDDADIDGEPPVMHSSASTPGGARKSRLQEFLDNSTADDATKEVANPQTSTQDASLGTLSNITPSSESSASGALVAIDTKETRGAEGETGVEDHAPALTVEDFFTELEAVKDASDPSPALHFSFAKVLNRIKKHREKLASTRARSILTRVEVSAGSELSEGKRNELSQEDSDERFEDRLEDRVSRIESLIQEMDSFTATLPDESTTNNPQEPELEELIDDMIGAVIQEAEEDLELSADSEDFEVSQLQEAILKVQEEASLTREAQVLEVSRESPGVLLIKTTSTTAMGGTGISEGSESEESMQSGSDGESTQSILQSKGQPDLTKTGIETAQRGFVEDASQGPETSGNDADIDLSSIPAEDEELTDVNLEAAPRSLRPSTVSHKDIPTNELPINKQELTAKDEHEDPCSPQVPAGEELHEYDSENPALDREGEPVQENRADAVRLTLETEVDIEEGDREQNSMSPKTKRTHRLIRRPSEDDSFAHILARFGRSTEVEEQQQCLRKIVSHVYGFNSTFTSNHRICHRVISSGAIGATAKLLKQPSVRKTSGTVLECFKLYEGLLKGCPELLTAEDVGSLLRVILSTMHEHIYDPRVQESGCRVLAGLHEVEAMPTLVDVIASDKSVSSMSLQTISVLVHVFTEYQLDNRVLAAASILLEKVAVASPQSAELLGEVNVVKTLVKCFASPTVEGYVAMRVGKGLLEVLTLSSTSIKSNDQEKIGRTALQLLERRATDNSLSRCAELVAVCFQLIAKICRKKDNIRRRLLRSGAVSRILNAMRRNKREANVQHCGCLALISLTERSERHEKHLAKREFNALNVVVEAIREHSQSQNPVLMVACIQLLHRLLIHAHEEKHALLVQWVIAAMESSPEDVRLQETGLQFLNRCELNRQVLERKLETIKALVREIRKLHRSDQAIQELARQLLPSE